MLKTSPAVVSTTAVTNPGMSRKSYLAINPTFTGSHKEGKYEPSLRGSRRSISSQLCPAFTSGVKILMKPNIGFHLSCLT